MTDWQRVPELEADVKSGKVSLQLNDIPRGKPHIIIDPDDCADDKRIAELEAEVARLRAAAQCVLSYAQRPLPSKDLRGAEAFARLEAAVHGEEVEDAPVLPDVPAGCERWEWHPEIDRGCYLFSRFSADQRWPDYHVPRARYYEFACPDGRVRQGAAPTAWWDTITQFLYSFAEGRDGRWLHASAAIVEVA